MPKTHSEHGAWELKPYDLGTWNLWDRVLLFQDRLLNEYQHYSSGVQTPGLNRRGPLFLTLKGLILLRLLGPKDPIISGFWAILRLRVRGSAKVYVGFIRIHREGPNTQIEGFQVAPVPVQCPKALDNSVFGPKSLKI